MNYRLTELKVLLFRHSPHPVSATRSEIYSRIHDRYGTFSAQRKNDTVAI